MELPEEALVSTKKIEQFSWRVENLVMVGGFALICGESGLGKSVALRVLNERLSRLPDVTVQELSRPQSSLSDFYRELGSLFHLDLNVRNRYGGFAALRERWKSHIESTLFRPVLLIDEAQEMQPTVLSELRLLSSMHFDSQIILTTVLSGDSRLPEKFRSRDLIPLGNRIRVRLVIDPWHREDLAELLSESLQRAGAPHLMTKELTQTLSEHAAGSPRVLMNMAHELLVAAAKKEITQLDEKLYLEVFAPDAPVRSNRRRVAA